MTETLSLNPINEQATIPLPSAQSNNSVRLVAVKNVGDCMKFLSR